MGSLFLAINICATMCIVAFFYSKQRAASLVVCFRVTNNCCAIHVMLLPTFSQMCPCLLLAGAHVTLGGAPVIYSQCRHAMSNTPFDRLIWFCTSFLCLCTLFTPAPFVICHVFLIFVALITLPFLLLLALIPMSSAILPSAMLLPSVPFVVQDSLFHCIVLSSPVLSSTYPIGGHLVRSGGVRPFQWHISTSAAHIQFVGHLVLGGGVRS